MSDIIKFDVNINRQQGYVGSIDMATMTDVYIDQIRRNDVSIEQSFVSDVFINQKHPQDKEL